MKTTVFTFILTVLFLPNVYSQPSFSVEVKGSGEPVLLFPGFGCTGEVWNETVEELSKTNECHIFTFAGFGDVPAIEMPWLSTIKNEIISYVKTNELEKPILLGHSLGGTLSLWLASVETDLFKKVIAVDALPGAVALFNPAHQTGDVIPYDNPQSQAMLAMSDEDFRNMNSQSIPFMCLNKEKQNVIAEWMNVADRETYVYGYIDYLNLDLREEIARIKIPVTVLGATYPDKVTVQNTYNAQFEKLPSVKIEYADNSAHFVMFDQPEWFLEKVKENIR